MIRLFYSLFIYSQNKNAYSTPSGSFCPWNSQGRNTGADGFSCLQGIFPIQRLNPGLSHWNWVSCIAGWITSWNQESWEKYQQPQICSWYHFNDKKWTGTKEPLDESGRGEWKIWLKTQHSKSHDHGIWSHHFMANRWEKMEIVTNVIYWTPKSLWIVTVAMKIKDTCSFEEKLWQT